jgi:hypothetical protein
LLYFLHLFNCLCSDIFYQFCSSHVFQVSVFSQLYHYSISVVVFIFLYIFM